MIRSSNHVTDLKPPLPWRRKKALAPASSLPTPITRPKGSREKCGFPTKSGDGQKAPQDKAKSATPEPAGGPKQRPWRQTLFTSRYYFSRTVKIWHLLLASLPLDLLLFMVPGAPFEFPEAKDSLLAMLLVAGLLIMVGVLRNPILSFLYQREDRGASPSKKWQLIAGAIVILGVFLELILKLGIHPMALAIAAIVAVSAIRSVKDTMNKSTERKKRMGEDPTFWVEQSNLMVFAINILPLGAARALSLIGMFASVIFSVEQTGGLAYFAAAAALLLAFHPQESDFMIQCRRCGRVTSRILKKKGLCPGCDESFGIIAQVKAANAAKPLPAAPSKRR